MAQNQSLNHCTKNSENKVVKIAFDLGLRYVAGVGSKNYDGRGAMNFNPLGIWELLNSENFENIP